MYYLSKSFPKYELLVLFASQIAFDDFKRQLREHNFDILEPNAGFLNYCISRKLKNEWLLEVFKFETKTET